MRAFWLPIGLRAACIFAIGMLLYAGGRFVKRHTHFDSLDERRNEPVLAAEAASLNARRAAESDIEARLNGHLSARLAGVGALAKLAGMSKSNSMPPDFIFDGAKLGSLVRFKGARAARDNRAKFALVVRLDDGKKAVSCDIVPVQPDDFDLDKGFRCSSPGQKDLVSVGQVTFEPGGHDALIVVSSRTAEELAKGDPFAIDADLTGPMNLMVNGKDGERVQLKSDSQNTALVVHDDQGRAVVRMQAGKNGFSIVVDTTGH